MENSRNSLKESLSALMDGEHDELELRRVLRNMDEDAQLAETWRRYHLVRTTLSREIHADPSVNLLGNIQERLDQEGLYASPPARSSQFLGRLARLAGQGAIAASVAIMVLSGVTMLDFADTSGSGDAQLTAQSELPALGGEYSASELTRVVRMDDAARNRLQQAVIQFSSSPGGQIDTTTAGFPFEPFEPFIEEETPSATNTDLTEGNQAQP